MLGTIFGIIFVILFENIHVVVGLIVTALVVRKAVKWLGEHPEECRTSFLD